MAEVLLTTPFFPELIERINAAGHAVFVPDAATSMTYEALTVSIAKAEALICLLSDRIDGEMLQTAARLRVIANVAVGYENIDVETARGLGIVVTNTPDVLTETTADLTFGLILAVARRIAEADHAVRRGEFPQWGLEQPLMGRDVYGKTLGIFGMGRIGSAVARRGHLGFGMPVLYFGRSRNPMIEEEIGARWVPFERLLAESDVLSIHAPGGSETQGRFDRAAFAAMKPAAILINVARGSIVEEGALIEALETGRLAGAGLDVYSDEPDVPSGLRGMTSRVVLTPHLGSATHETRYAMASLAVDNILAVLAGRPPITPVS
jgi:glyoxylate reductase